MIAAALTLATTVNIIAIAHASTTATHAMHSIPDWAYMVYVLVIVLYVAALAFTSTPKRDDS